jgi:hypothetical protein
MGAAAIWAVLFPLFTGIAWGGASFVGAIWNVVVGSYRLALAPTSCGDASRASARCCPTGRSRSARSSRAC